MRSYYSKELGCIIHDETPQMGNVQFFNKKDKGYSGMGGVEYYKNPAMGINLLDTLFSAAKQVAAGKSVTDVVTSVGVPIAMATPQGQAAQAVAEQTYLQQKLALLKQNWMKIALGIGGVVAVGLLIYAMNKRKGSSPVLATNPRRRRRHRRSRR